jgi:branched-subunit amino acid aminotransferase/4-amino-4-deoxychorismate lyase
MIEADDRGFSLGDGLFETLLAIDGRMIDWTAHERRLMAGCEALGLPSPSPDRLRAAADAALTQSGLATGRAAVRVNWSAGRGGRGLVRPSDLTPALSASAAVAPDIAGPADVIIASVRRNETSPAARFKTLSYLDNVLARREAQAVDADEALMLNTRGDLACASAANIFWVHDGALVTPALDCGVLAGTLRARVIGWAEGEGIEVRQVRQGAEALDQADAVFLTNSLIGVRSVKNVNGRTFDARPFTAIFGGSP